MRAKRNAKFFVNRDEIVSATCLANTQEPDAGHQCLVAFYDTLSCMGLAYSEPEPARFSQHNIGAHGKWGEPERGNCCGEDDYFCNVHASNNLEAVKPPQLSHIPSMVAPPGSVLSQSRRRDKPCWNGQVRAGTTSFTSRTMLERSSSCWNHIVHVTNHVGTVEFVLESITGVGRSVSTR